MVVLRMQQLVIVYFVCELTLPCTTCCKSFSISKLINIEHSILDYEFVITYSKVTSPLAIGLDRLQMEY